jgi:hypothetical protein
MSMAKSNYSAEELAILAFTNLANDSHNLDRFLRLTGLNPDTLRQSATERHFLASVLYFFVNHEPDLLVLSENIGISPTEFIAAHRKLSSKDPPGTGGW